MRAMLLAGGRGERLRPLTDTMPKCLVPIDHEPLLGIWLDLCVRHGVTDVLINISQHAPLVRQFLDSYRGAARVTLVEEHVPRGNAGTVRAHRDFLNGDASVVVLYSDNLTTVNLSDLWRFHHTHADLVTMGVFQTTYPRMAGLVTLDEERRVVDFVEKPVTPASNLANAGIYVLRREVLDCIPEGEIVDFAHDVFPRCLGRMRAFEIREYLLDIGHPAALARAQAEWPGQRLTIPAHGAAR